MSLISDSLKRASEERTVTGGPSPAFNLVGFGEDADGEKFSWGRFLILVVLPAVVLGGLLYIGINRPVPAQAVRSGGAPAMEAQAGPETPSVAPLPDKVKESPVDKAATVSPVPGKLKPADSAPAAVASPASASTHSQPVKKAWPVDEKQEEAKPVQPVVAAPEKKTTKIQKKPVAVKKSSAASRRKTALQEKTGPSETTSASRVKVRLSEAKKSGAKKTQVASVSLQASSQEPTGPVAGIPDPMAEKPVSNPKLYQDAEFYFKMGVFYQRTGDHFEALEYYNKALELDPANAEIYNNRSLIYKELGKPDRAVRGFLKAIQLDPGYVKAYNNIGLLYYEKHNLAAAVSSFEKAISIDPRNLESYNNLAIVYKKQNNLPKARQLYQTILKKNPGHVEAHYNLALLYEEEGDYTKAVEHYQSFVDLGQTQRPELVSRVRKHLELLR
ncbi:MAG: tetratricopeptide repeat protein [Nitrospina sp.]|nr:tetratricopeptide repeat protein [Nitrospina sp.]